MVPRLISKPDIKEIKAIKAIKASLLNTLQGFCHVDSHYLAAHKEVHDK